MSVSPGEKLTRFIRYSNQFSSANKVVRYRAFIPPRKSVNLSVFRISLSPQLLEKDVWQIGQEHVQGEGIPIKARADIRASGVYENKLEVIPDEPPQRHANITPFPVDNKARQSIARKLAVVSELVMPPDPS
jgi:hypothetical protein